MSANYVTIKKAAVETGYTEQAIRDKIQDKVWREYEVWVRAPDGKPLISMEGYEKWVETGQVSKRHRTVPLKSPSPMKEASAGRGSSSSPPPLT